MKSLSIKSLLLVSALFMPLLHAQDALVKVREIERKVLQIKYHAAIEALVVSAREAESGEPGASPETIGKRAQWVTLVGNQLEAEDKTSASDQQEVKENAKMLNELAWKMLTTSNADARQPDIALKLVTIAIELGGGNKDLTSKFLDTKARALLMLGKRGEAIAEQKKAIAAATSADPKAELEATLATYTQDGLPEVTLPAHQQNLPAGKATPSIAAARIEEKLRTIIFPRIEFENVTLEDAVHYLRYKSTELDPSQSAKGVNIVVQNARVGEASANPALIIKNLSLRDVPLKSALEYICKQVGYQTKVDDSAVILLPQDGVDNSGGAKTPSVAAARIEEKLRTIVFPRIEFEEVPLEEAVEYLRMRSIEYDPSQSAKGVNIVVQNPRPGDAPAKPDALIIKKLSLRDVPLKSALEYICKQVGYQTKVDDSAVILLPQDGVDKTDGTKKVIPSHFAPKIESSPRALPIE